MSIIKIHWNLVSCAESYILDTNVSEAIAIEVTIFTFLPIQFVKSDFRKGFKNNVIQNTLTRKRVHFLSFLLKKKDLLKRGFEIPLESDRG